MRKTVVTIILIALIVGGGVYFWQQQKTAETNDSVYQSQQLKSLDQTSETPESTSPTTQPEVTSSQKESPQYSSIDKYVELALNPSTNGQYRTSKPSEFQRAKFGGKGEGINVAPDGVSADVFVVAKGNWDIGGSLEDIQTFYLEVVGPSPCWTEPNCNEPNTVNFYGPFEGKLKLLVQ